MDQGVYNEARVKRAELFGNNFNILFTVILSVKETILLYYQYSEVQASPHHSLACVIPCLWLMISVQYCYQPRVGGLFV